MTCLGRILRDGFRRRSPWHPRKLHHWERFAFCRRSGQTNRLRTPAGSRLGCELGKLNRRSLTINYDDQQIAVSEVQWRDGARICAGLLLPWSNACRQLACRPPEKVLLEPDESAVSGGYPHCRFPLSEMWVYGVLFGRQVRSAMKSPNPALQRTRPSRPGCDHRIPSLLRSSTDTAEGCAGALNLSR